MATVRILQRRINLRRCVHGPPNEVTRLDIERERPSLAVNRVTAGPARGTKNGGLSKLDLTSSGCVVVVLVVLCSRAMLAAASIVAQDEAYSSSTS